MNPTENLTRIKELADSLQLSDLVLNSNSVINYDCPQGACKGVGLLKEKAVAVQDTILKPNTIFPLHVHNEIELLILVDGEFTSTINNKETKITTPGRLIVIDPGEEHFVYTKDGCRMIAVTIPANIGGYPSAG